MTTKHLVGTYTAGYALQSPTTTLSIAASGYVGGKGVYTPASDSGPYTIVNAGRIVDVQNFRYDGVYLGHGGSVTNGSSTTTSALIQGFDTVTNFGTIAGAGGATVEFETSSNELIVEADSRFIGAVQGGGSTLVLASGLGSVSLAQTAGGMNETVTGSMDRTVFSDFATVEVGAGAAFTVTDDAVIEAGQSLVAAGGALTFAKAITGAGAIEAGAGGTLAVEPRRPRPWR